MQSAKASCPIWVTDEGIVTDLMLVLPEKAPDPMAVTGVEPTLEGIETFESLPLYSVITPPDAPKLFSGFVVC